MERAGENSNVLLGRRIRALRHAKGWSQEELGGRADINYKFLGEIERDHQNPSFNVLLKISTTLQVKLPELFRFEQQTSDRKEIKSRIGQILKGIPTERLSQILWVLRGLYSVG